MSPAGYILKNVFSFFQMPISSMGVCLSFCYNDLANVLSTQCGICQWLIFFRPPIAPSRNSHGHIFRQDRFDLTPGNSQEMASPPVMHHPASSRDHIYRRGRLTIEQRGDTGTTTATSKSTASGTSLTLTSSASLMSSQTDDSEDESKRRVSW